MKSRQRAVALVTAFLFTLLLTLLLQNFTTMTAKGQAIQDIKDELKNEDKCFIAFRKNLNLTINAIVAKYIKQQEKKHQ